jgi:mevalonate kinase
MVRASAPGKVIILGDHFVVHGSSAISAAISKRASVSVKESEGQGLVSFGGTKSSLYDDDGKFVAVKAVARNVLAELKESKNLHISIESEIPAGSGLGSSAAVSVSTAAALLRFFGQNAEGEVVSNLARAGEAAVHGNPSGIDVATCLSGGAIMFNRSSGYKAIKGGSNTRLLVVFTNIERNTKDLIDKVSLVRKTYPSFFESLSKSMSDFSVMGARAIEEGNLPLLGALMNFSETALSWIGVSNKPIEELIEKINAAGPCYGAKLTGAGGGGSVIALPEENIAEKIVPIISKEYPFAFLTNLSQEGLKVDE